jgi:hypothetical protein
VCHLSQLESQSLKVSSFVPVSKKVFFSEKNHPMAVSQTSTISSRHAAIRVARWFAFKPKNSNLGKFGRVLQGKMLVCIFYGHLIGPFYGLLLHKSYGHLV